MTTGDGGRLEERRVRPGVPRDNISQARAFHLTRGWLTVMLGVGALPAAVLARVALGLDDHLVFAAVWAAAALLQAPPLVHRYDWIALAGLGAYFIAFLLPAGVSAGVDVGDGNVVITRLRGYEALLEPPVHPLPNLPPGELLALAVGVTSWLANPAMIIALAFYRFREATWALVLGGLAVGMGAMELPGVQPDLAHVAWLGAPALVAVAGAIARDDY